MVLKFLLIPCIYQIYNCVIPSRHWEYSEDLVLITFVAVAGGVQVVNPSGAALAQLGEQLVVLVVVM